MAARTETLTSPTTPLFHRQIHVDQEALRKIVGPPLHLRESADHVEFARLAPELINDTTHFSFVTKDERAWTVRFPAAKRNHFKKPSRNFDFVQFKQTLFGLQRTLGENDQGHGHDGVVDLYWKNWGLIWDYFQPGQEQRVKPECFREVELKYFLSENNGIDGSVKATYRQPDLIGIDPNGAIHILEVGGRGSREIKLEKIRIYEQAFKRVFGDAVPFYSHVVYYRPFPFNAPDGYFTAAIQPSELRGT